MLTSYWLFEYGKVVCGYLLLMFLWPSVVFGGYLRKKTRTYRFSFCVTIQVVVINAAVLVLGLLHILNRWIVFLLFYGIFFLALFWRMYQKMQMELQCLAAGSLGWKSFIAFVRGEVSSRLSLLWESVRVHLWEYAVLAFLLIYGVLYFSYGVFLHQSYGFGDLYAHHAWINGLAEGKIFSGGIYPEGMHCFIYCLYAVFGIRVYSSLLFLAGIHVAVYLISAYCFMREVYHWRAAALLVLTLFLTLDLKYIDAVESMARFQWTLPQEFGLYMQFLCALYLVRYLRYSGHVLRKGENSRYCWDENLFLFMAALTASAATHFYITIMAFLLCGSFALCYIKRASKREYMIPLAAVSLCGCLIAVLPMAGAYAQGIPLQSSLNWAAGVIRDSIGSKAAGAGLLKKLLAVYQRGYEVMYGQTRTMYLILLYGFIIGLCLFFWRAHKERLRDVCAGYLPVVFASFLFMVAFAASGMGLPQLIDSVRLCSTEYMLVLMVAVMPLDLLFSVIMLTDRALQAISVFCTAGIYAATMLSGNFHGYLYSYFARYDVAVTVTNSIVENFPRYSYTIVSPTDDKYQAIEYGYHEELLSFVEKCREADYILPTEYVFIYIEKKPIQYGQFHFFRGPSWLASDKYPELYMDDTAPQGNGAWSLLAKYPDAPGISLYPKVIASAVSEEAAQGKLLDADSNWDIYMDYASRITLESRGYDLCRRFMQLYPLEMHVYYEDENFVCYCLRQEPNSPYNLGLE